MKFTYLSLLFLFYCFFAIGIAFPTPGDLLFQEAKAEENNNNYHAAEGKYYLAYLAYTDETNQEKAILAHHEMYRMEGITFSYPYTEAEIRTLLINTYSHIIPISRIDGWIVNDELDFLLSDGQKWYFSDTVQNVLWRNKDIGFLVPSFQSGLLSFYNQMNEFLTKEHLPESPPYIQPQNIIGTATLKIPYSELPKTGLLKVWVPLPLSVPEQKISIISVPSRNFLKMLPRADNEDLRSAYFEIPIEKIKSSLEISIEFQYQIYEQFFQIVPNLVGSYETDSDFYKKYTVSTDSIKITPAIQNLAKSIVGSETNAYLAARLLYDYMIDNISYGLFAHLTYWELGLSESEVVLEKGYGDCGAQAIFLVALLRSAGIMARVYGGYEQFFPNSTHCWCQIYLPNYGWIPIDPSIGSIAYYIANVSPDFLEKNKNYHFGHQDNKRLVTFNGNNLPLSPPLPIDLFPFYYLVYQKSIVYCEENPNINFDFYIDFKITPPKVIHLR